MGFSYALTQKSFFCLVHVPAFCNIMEVLCNRCKALAMYMLSLRWLRVQSLCLKLVWPVCSRSTGLSSQCLDDTESSWSQSAADTTVWKALGVLQMLEDHLVDKTVAQALTYSLNHHPDHGRFSLDEVAVRDLPPGAVDLRQITVVTPPAE